MLAVQGLVAGYPGGGIVLDGLDLAISEGESVAILGRNGMGKTTLLRAIMGHVAARSGSIGFCGREITGLRPFTISNLGIAYVPQGREIFGDFTVEENLIMGVLGKRSLAATVPESIYAYFPILAERRRQRAGTMSGGEQQQLAIARALMGRPRLLLLDEPSEGIQPSIVQAISASLRRIAADEKLTLLLVEQNLELVLALAGRCLFMEEGRIVDEAQVSHLRSDPSLLDRYLSM
jgi:branched-chain amino acid transport system ATP-binding protein/urea transport system ATP-binding protein